MKNNNGSTLNVEIIGSGTCIPPFVVTNDDLEKFYPSGPYPQYGSPFNWNVKWIEEKLGIFERRFVYDMKAKKIRDGWYDLDMGEKATRAALDDAGIDVKNIDSIIYISSTPEYFMPDSACSLHLRLGAGKDTSAFSLTSAGCGGFIYGMINATSIIGSGMAEMVLVVASNSTSAYMSQYEDPNLSPEEVLHFKTRDRLNASMFGDGAGAIILRRTNSNSKKGLLNYYWGADGSHNPVIFEAGGSRNPATIETVRKGMHFFNMDGRMVADVAPALFERTIKKVLEKSNLPLSDIDYFIFHQVNCRLLKSIADSMHIPLEKMVIHADHYGNLDTVALAVGYHESKMAGKIKSGDKVLFAAVGAGWQYGSMIMRI